MNRILILLLLALLVACKQETGKRETRAAVETVRFTGKTMGTSYSVVYLKDELVGGANEVAMKNALDSALVALNDEVSNWEKASTVVRFNQSAQGIDVGAAPHFLANYLLALEAFELSNGAFEPTILPLTDYWGFGAGEERIKAGVDTSEVMRRLALVGMNKIALEADTFLRKQQPNVQLDLGGSAKGYGSDLMAAILKDQFGLKNVLVEIGGEMYAAGRKSPDQTWTVGINLPKETAALNEIAELMPLENKGVATSGNYRNYYKVDGATYSHTLNPKTGFPERNTLLSASVVAPNCARADAFATACMVLGPNEAMKLIESRPELEAYFLVRTEDGDMEARLSSGLKL